MYIISMFLLLTLAYAEHCPSQPLLDGSAFMQFSHDRNVREFRSSHTPLQADINFTNATEASTIVALALPSQALSYELLTSGSCAVAITSIDECSSAAEQLGLSDTTASDDGQSRASWDPPYCYFENSNLKFNSDGRNRGPCTRTDKCLCQVANTPASGGTCADPDPNTAGTLDYRCPTGYQAKSPAVPDGVCTDVVKCIANCCEVSSTCGQKTNGSSGGPVTCPAGYTNSASAATTTCSVGLCDTSTSASTDTVKCCQATCASYSCPTGYEIINSDSTTLSQSNCCQACASGHASTGRRRTGIKQLCPSGYSELDSTVQFGCCEACSSGHSSGGRRRSSGSRSWGSSRWELCPSGYVEADYRADFPCCEEQAKCQQAGTWLAVQHTVCPAGYSYNNDANLALCATATCDLGEGGADVTTCCKMTCHSLDDATWDCQAGSKRKADSDTSSVSNANDFQATCCEAAYVDAGITNICPSSYASIMSRSDCQEAGSALYPSATRSIYDGNWAHHVNGCFWKGTNNFIHFNVNTGSVSTSGDAAEDHKLCKLGQAA